MGGSSKSSELTPQAKRKIKEIGAKKILSEGDVKRNVFISFSTKDKDDVNLIRAQAKKEKSNIDFNDRSLKEPVNSENEEYIKRRIRERIRYCTVTIVYVSDNTADSDWVDWEIRESLAMGKGVIAMHKGETCTKRLPNAITENNIAVLPWKQQQINDAIQEKAESR